MSEQFKTATITAATLHTYMKFNPKIVVKVLVNLGQGMPNTVTLDRHNLMEELSKFPSGELNVKEVGMYVVIV